jgi:transcriptional regulator with XRE-family HTH domain
VIDKTQVINDLVDLRTAIDKSQIQFEDAAGVTRGKLQRIESGQATIDIADMEAFLIAGGISAAIYFGRIAMLEELQTLNQDADLVEKFKRALKIPTKRTTLKAVLDGMFADEKWNVKTRREPRERRRSPSEGRSEK